MNTYVFVRPGGESFDVRAPRFFPEAYSQARAIDPTATYVMTVLNDPIYAEPEPDPDPRKEPAWDQVQRDPRDPNLLAGGW